MVYLVCFLALIVTIKNTITILVIYFHVEVRKNKTWKSKKKKDMKIIFIDVETTGLDFEKSAPIELGYEVYEKGEVVKAFNYFITPFKNATIQLEALEVSGASVNMFSRYTEEREVYVNFVQDLKKLQTEKHDKIMIAGWRAPEFDTKFLKQFFKRNGGETTYKELFYDTSIDVKSLATQHLLKYMRCFDNGYNLAEVASFLGIEFDKDKLHSAIYDTIICRKIYEKLTGYDKNRHKTIISK